MNIETISHFVRFVVVPILFFVFAIIKYFIRFSLKQREQKSRDYNYQMRAIGSNKGRMSKKRYKQLEREMNFQAAYNIDLSDKIISNIFKANRPKVILDNIKMARGKLEISDDNRSIIYRPHYKFELAMNYAFGYFGLFVIALGGLTLYFQNDWVGFAVFLFFIIGGFTLVILTAQDLARYRAAKKVIDAYDKIIQKTKMISI